MVCDECCQPVAASDANFMDGGGTLCCACRQGKENSRLTWWELDLRIPNSVMDAEVDHLISNAVADALEKIGGELIYIGISLDDVEDMEDDE